MMIDRIIKHLKTVQSSSDWDIANALYNNCMNQPHPANGARIANIVKTCNKSKLIKTFHSNENRFYFLVRG